MVSPLERRSRLQNQESVLFQQTYYDRKLRLRKGEFHLEIRPTTRSAAKALLTLIKSPTRLGRLKALGFDDFSAVFSLESQMRPRVAFLTRCAFGF